MTYNGQKILAVVIQEILPRIFLNFKRLFLMVNRMRFRNLIAHALEMLHNIQQEGTHPEALVRVLLAGFDIQNRFGGS